MSIPPETTAVPVAVVPDVGAENVTDEPFVIPAGAVVFAGIVTLVTGPLSVTTPAPSAHFMMLTSVIPPAGA